MMNNVAIILNYNDFQDCQELLSIIKNYNSLMKIIVVDNCSVDDSFERLKVLADEKIDVVKTDKNGGYSYGNNFGVLHAIRNYNNIDNFLICNPDVLFEEDALLKVEKVLQERQDAALVGAIITPPNATDEIDLGFAWHTIDIDMIFRSIFKPWRYIMNRLTTKPWYYELTEIADNNPLRVDTVKGCFFLIRAKQLVKIGLFDERVFLYSEEDIINRKLSKLKSDEPHNEYVATDAKVVHKGSQSIKKNIKSPNQISKYSYLSRIYFLKEYLNANVLIIQLYRLLYKIKWC